MTIAFARPYRLVPRGEAGLACDDDGVALGPLRLVEAVTDADGCRVYRPRPAEEIAEALRLAYGAAPDEIERSRRGLAEIARLLTAGERAQAGIRAVQLAFPEIAPDAMAKLAQAASLQKDNPNLAGEPRIPAGNPGGGEWTNDGGAAGSDPNIRPIAAPLNPAQAMKQRFVDAHLADTQKAADQFGVPVENILGVAALESNWGNSRIAVQGNNFFGIDYPARYAVWALANSTWWDNNIFQVYKLCRKSEIVRRDCRIAGPGQERPRGVCRRIAEQRQVRSLQQRSESADLCAAGCRNNSWASRDRRSWDAMKQVLRAVIQVAGLIGTVMILCHGALAGGAKIMGKLDKTAAQYLAAEAVYGRHQYLNFFYYDDNMSSAFSPPFLVFQGASKPPSEGSFGYFAVNPWTGDVWNLWGCHRLSTPALRRSQAEIRQRFSPAELQQYVRLRRLKPACTVED